MLDSYDILLIVVGLAVLATAVLPTLLADRPLSMPIAVTALGAAAFALPLGLDAPDPLVEGELAERLTELAVIVALMGAGLKLDRRVGLRAWGVTWRLLAVAMPLTVAATALLGWWAGLVPAAAVLLGAAASPTDPVLASEVQVGEPNEPDEEDEVRFGLTSEAGLNDGLAFPYTNMAVAMAVAGTAPAAWFAEWLAVDVAYKLGSGLVAGFVLGRLLARVVLRFEVDSDFARSMAGLGAIAVTLVAYGVTELVGGYGFVATFVAAVTLRDYERDHHYHASLHDSIEKAERLIVAGVLVLFGGALATGLLSHLTWPLALAGLALIFVVRPAAGWLSLLGDRRSSGSERAAIAFFGIRGIGSFYYVAYALNHAEFAGEEAVWSVVGFVVLVSIVVHGVLGGPAMRWLDVRRARARG